MDGITQEDDDNFTQGTAVSRSTIFTNATQNTFAITQEDIDAFQRAIENKNSDLCYDLGNMKKQHRIDEDNMQKEILELQGKKNAIDNGEFLFHVYLYSLPVGPCLTILSFNPNN